MAGKPAALSEGIRLSDLMSTMVLANVFPLEDVREVLAQTGKTSQRERNLPAPFMVYYMMALGLYRHAPYQEVLRCIFEAFTWLSPQGQEMPISCKAALSQARTRLGPEPMRLLYQSKVRPIAEKETPDAFFASRRVISLDGSVMNLGDTTANAEAFGRPGVSRGPGSAFPQLRFVTLVENGTHVLFGAVPGPYATSEVTLARDVVKHLEPGMLCLADRFFYGFELWSQAASTGSDLLWRVRKNQILPCEERFPDGSYLSTIYPSTVRLRQKRDGKRVRVVEYQLAEPKKNRAKVTQSGSKKGNSDGLTDDTDSNEEKDEGETIYRLITTILDPTQASALDLAKLYACRWEIETTLDEFKTHLHGHDLVLRSKTPGGVYQEFWGLMLAHHAVRHIMHQAAQSCGISAQRLSYTHSLREIRRKLPQFLVIPP